MAFHLTNIGNVSDDATLELDGAGRVATAIAGTTTYLFVVGFTDDGVSVFSVAADGTLTNVDNVTDDGTVVLNGPDGVTTAVVAGTPYLFVSSISESGVSVFSVAADGTLTNVDNVTDTGALELSGATGLATAEIGGTTFLFVAGNSDDGVNVFAVAYDGTLASVETVNDDAIVELDAATSVATAVIAGTAYLFVAGIADDGVSVFSVAADGALTNVDNVTDDVVLALDGANGVTTAVVAGTTYLFVASFFDRGVSVFSVAADGTLTNVDNVSDDGTLQLAGAIGVTTAVIDGTTYLFVTGNVDRGLSVFEVAADGTLTNVANVADDATMQLFGVVGVANAAVGGTHYLFAAGNTDDGVSVFTPTGDIPLLGDVLWQHADGTVAIADHELPAVLGGFRIAETGDFDGDGDSDIVWRHTEGDVVTWELENGDFLAAHSLPDVAITFQIAGTGDFDRDGDDDILWRHDEGLNVIWEMEDGALVTNHNLPVVPDSFAVAGVGDFDGDGDDDILWRHDEGLNVIWEMEDGAFVTNHNLPVVPNSFAVAGIGDFDSDGDVDIVWRHDEGLNVIWEMEDAAFVTNHNLPAVATSWRIEGAEDFDSDGDADILWRHDEGTVVTWEIEDNALLQTHNFGQVSNAWQIRGTGEFDLV